MSAWRVMADGGDVSMKPWSEIALLAGVALVGCGRPAAEPARPASAMLGEHWQTVAVPNRQACPNKLACLVGLSASDRPTKVSVKQVPFTRIRSVDACMPNVPAPGLTSATISFETYISEAQATGVSAACPAFASDRPAAGRSEPNEAWSRSDRRQPFEAQNSLAYSFLPLGSSDTPEGRHIRCVVVFDPSAIPEDLPRLALGEASDTCLVLHYFRERPEV